MAKYFVAPDAADEPTIWEEPDSKYPPVVIRRAELPSPHADLLWRVLTGVLTADDETVERIGRAIFDEIKKYPHDPNDIQLAGRIAWGATERDVAKVALAALREVQ